ncbi:MAG: hypothetical protein PHU46_02995 [Rhodocyclaceae bacterium]|nr:hypothetical protein [Rhodocyclaceae bacterium]
MKTRPTRPRLKATMLLVGTLATATAIAGGDNAVELSVGAEFSTGKYGKAEATDTWYTPVVLRYRAERLSLGLTLPYIQTQGPAAVVGSLASQMLMTAGAGMVKQAASGPGDVEASAGYLVLEDQASGWLIETVGKAKFPTGDPAKGLGTGSRDYALEVQFAHGGEILTSFGNLGWRRMGNSEGLVLSNAWSALFGVGRNLSPTTQLGAAWNYRQQVLEGSPPVRELMLYLTLAAAPTARFQAYLVKGYSDGSPDKGLGLSWNRDF